jgi:uncharacterized protein
MIVSRSALIAAFALAATLASACGPVLAPQRDMTKFYTLSPIDNAAASEPMPLSIGIGPINLPAYLDRTEVVTRSGPNEMKVSENNRWAEPLTTNFNRTLTENLSRLLGPRQILQFPWYANNAPDFQIEIVVYRFETDSKGNAVLAGKWTIRNPRDQKMLYSSDMNITEPAGSGDQAGAAALSRALGQLSQEIAATIRQLPPPQPHTDSRPSDTRGLMRQQ